MLWIVAPFNISLKKKNNLADFWDTLTQKVMTVKAYPTEQMWGDKFIPLH